jgi:molybdenum cofactor cytidylyltransferase
MLAPIGDEKTPLLRRVCETWLDSGIRELLIVLGSDASTIRLRFEEDLLRKAKRDDSAATSVRFMENPNWSAGMFSSVKVGLAEISPRSTHVAISPADLPFLSRDSLRRVLDAAASLGADEKTIVVPTHGHRRGHPLVIPAALKARILSWPDSARLNRIFEEPDLEILHLEGFDETILRDVDRPEDLVAGSEISSS